jgi:putative glutamine amidotransferase
MSLKNLFFIILAGLPAILLFACNRQKPLTIVVSKLSPNYLNWIKSADSTVNVIDLYELSTDSALKILQTAHGVLITGGEDVYPAFYGKETDTARCDKPDRRRDTLEMALIKKAFDLKMPVFGICRGQQIINVVLGGTLIVDIPADLGTSIQHRCIDYLNCLHRITVADSSKLKHISGVKEGLVNSNHHQAIDQIAAGLKPVAFSDDNVIEAVEWKKPEGKSFLLAVQWHPERLTQNRGMSEPLSKQFLAEAGKFRNK